MLVEWLDKVKEDASAIYFLGDVFDHWFEYRNVIPRGFTDFLGKLSEMRRLEIPLYFFTGNHDMWMFGFFENELGVPVIRKPLFLTLSDKRFYLNHGDGLVNGSFWDRQMKVIFSNRFLQWCFARLHPDFAIGIMKYFSKKSRLTSTYKDAKFTPENEHMIEFAEGLTTQHPDLDYIIMGHRHLPIDMPLGNGKTRYVNLGDWLNYFSYAVFDGKDLKVEFFKDDFPVYPIL